MFRPIDIRRLIDKFGREATIKYKTNGTYNTTTGKMSQTTSSVTVKGYFYDFRKEDDYDTLIGRGTRRFAISTVSTSGNAITKPKQGDIISGLGDDVKVHRVDEIMSGNKTICYLLRVSE